MTNYAKLDHVNHRIVMDRTFAKNAEILGSDAYKMLQLCRQDYPTYTVVRREIKRNTNQEHYRGLTYEYMREYIKGHESPEEVVEVLEYFNEMQLLAACHSRAKRYPVIKSWFLSRYPEVAQFGMPTIYTEITVCEPKKEPASATPSNQKKDA